MADNEDLRKRPRDFIPLHQYQVFMAAIEKGGGGVTPGVDSWVLEDGLGVFELEDGTGSWKLEANP